MDDSLLYAIFIYTLLISIIFIVKPELLYNRKTKTFKDFGFSDNTTYLPLPTLCCILSILSYLISVFIVKNFD